MFWHVCLLNTRLKRSLLTKGSKFLLLSSFNDFSIKKWCWKKLEQVHIIKMFQCNKKQQLFFVIICMEQKLIRFVKPKEMFLCLGVYLQTWISNLSLSGRRVHSSPLQHRELHLLQPSPLRGARSDTPLCPQPILPALQQTLV